YFDSEGDVTFLDNLLSDDALPIISLLSSVIESLPVSHIPVEDSEPAQEEIDIFLVPDDLIPPGVENDDFEDEDNESPNLDHQDDPSIPRPPPEPSDVEKCFEPEIRWHFQWKFLMLLSLRTNEFRDRVELATRIDPAISEDSRVRCCIPFHSSFSSFV
ncbi:hypothetical protein Tco_0818680, partial [Tanacetum coccineum]